MSEYEIMSQLTSNTFTGDVNKLFMNSAKKGHVGVVKLLLKDPRVDPGADNNYAIKWASRNGHVEIVKLLLKDPRVDPSVDDNYAIKWAADNGHVELVELLLNDPRADPGVDDNTAIGYAAENGHVEIVELLLNDPRVTPDTRDNYAIERASQNGHVEVVELLLNALKHRFNIAKYTEILAEVYESPSEILPEIKELLIDHIIKHQWIIKTFINQHLTTDLASQINHFIITN